MDKETIEWLREQVRGFIDVRPAYEQLSDTVEQILKAVRDRYAPDGRVEARAKSVASFAEKALRKRPKYQDPLKRMTDLAGGRLVAYTLEQVQAVCRWIEAQNDEGFEIDWENSRDAGRELKKGEFGYTGLHYVVKLCHAEILGVPVPLGVQSLAGRSLKAEIQVHTALQNAWSTVAHDRLYKTQIRVPEALEREVDAVAAILESTDQALDRSAGRVDRYVRNFEAYRTPAELQDDIEMWKAVHDHAPDDLEVTYQLGRRLMAALRWEEAYRTLKALAGTERWDMLTDLGQAATHVSSVPVDEARSYLERAKALAPRQVRAACLLAGTYLRDDMPRAIRGYAEVFDVDPDEPAVLVPFVECRLRQEGTLERLDLMRGALGAAAEQCHKRATHRVYLPQAHFKCARLHLYMGKDKQYKALSSYCMAAYSCSLPEMILEELDALTALVEALAKDLDRDALPEELVGFEWARRLLVVALAAGALARQGRPAQRGAEAWARAGESVAPQLRVLATPPSPATKEFVRPVVIVAGGCDPDFEKKLIETYGGLLEEAFGTFSGTLISGGTTSGISGMVGRLPSRPGRTLDKVGYLPGTLPGNDQRCDGYEIRPSPGRGYNPAGVLRAWADILLQEIPPGQVHILGIDGGDLTGFELRLGLALGAVVGVAEDSGRAVKTLLEQRTPCRPDGLVPLPPDAAIWAAFLRGASPELDRLTDKQVEPAARSVHEKFRQDSRGNTEKHDPSVLEWDEGLPEEYKASSRHQVRFATLILDAVGYDVVPAPRGRKLNPKRPPIPPGFERKVPAMARLEHGRFCAERLVDGWRYGPRKDLARKINATIVPWKKLPGRVRKYDFDAVRQFPKWLAVAGLMIVPRRKGA